MRRKKHIEELEQIKEIKEMADIIHEGDCPIVVLFYNDSLTLAENLYNKGYRKTSDVAREIFEEIEKISAKAYNDFMYNRRCTAEIENYVEQFSNNIDIDIAELKKKYESEGEG
jgi:hypothetical protein